MWLVKCNFVRIIPLSCKLVTNILLRSKFLLWNVWLIIVNCFRNSFLSDTSNNCFVHYYNFNPRLPSRMVKQLSMAIHKRSVGISCHSSHVLRLWHRLFVETSNAEAHADMYINDYDCIEANDSCLQFICQILHIHGRHCCFDVWQTFRELPDSRTSSTKRQELAFTRLSFTRTPFLYIGSRPAASTLGLRHSYFPMAVSQQTGTVPKTLLYN